jgi:hypothetical protein
MDSKDGQNRKRSKPVERWDVPKTRYVPRSMHAAAGRAVRRARRLSRVNKFFLQNWRQG